MTITITDVSKAGYFDNGKVHTGVRMKLGQNMAFPNYFSQSYPFINLCKTANILLHLNPLPGTENLGYYDTSTSGSFQFITHSTGRAYDIEAGTYVLRWVGTCNATWTTGGAGVEDDIGAAGYPTVNRREYTVTGNNTLTNAIISVSGGTCTNMELIAPGQEARLDAGNILHSKFVADMAGFDIIRLIDWMNASATRTRDVADIVPYGNSVWNYGGPPEVGNQGQVGHIPMQACGEAANELGVDLWWNVPGMVTDAALTQMATELNTALDAGRKVYVENGNEVWNFGTGIRLIDWMNASATRTRDVADIVPYGNSVWNYGGPPEVGNQGQVGHIPMQACGEAANELGVDLWWNVPGMVTDAALTQMATELNTALDAGRKVYVENGNEVWNFGSPWANGTHWMELGDVAPKDATVVPATGVCTFNGHGLTTEDSIRLFNNSTQNITGFIASIERFAIVDDVNTFRLASSAANAGSDIDLGVLNSLVTLIRYKETALSAKTQDVNYAERSIEMWDLVEAEIGAADTVRVICGQAGGSSHITNRIAVAGVREVCDFYAIAPYFRPKDVAADYENYTVEEMSAYVEFGPGLAILEAQVKDHIAIIGAHKLVLYECGEHNGGNTGQSQAQLDKIVEWARSSEATRMYKWYFKKLADMGVTLAVNFDSHQTYTGDNGTWGLMEHPQDTDAKKYLGVKDFLDNGGVPKN